MATVVIAAGSNLGDRLEHIQSAGSWLNKLSSGKVLKSSVWESEPVGGAKYTFYNCLAVIESELPAEELLKQLKDFEKKCGREENPVRWGPRVLDLDIIAYNSLAIRSDNLIIPHPEYHNRLFVLLPLKEVLPDWVDPVQAQDIDQMIKNAPSMNIHKTELNW